MEPLWQLTRGEYHKYRRAQGEVDPQKINREYRAIIVKAVSEGKPVAPEILAEYPDLRDSAGHREGDDGS